MSDQGKWQLAFWIISTLCGVWLVALTNNVIANDRIRSTEDSRIINDMTALMRDNMRDHSAIIGDLREIKAKMGIANGDK